MATYEIIDFEEVDNVEKESKPDDLASAFVGFFSTLNYKLLLFLFLIFLFLMSDVFVDKFLSNMGEDMVDMRNPTVKGTFVQGLLLVLLFIIMDLIIKLGFI